MIRWIVQASDPRKVGQLEIVSPVALDEGRVFVGPVRATSADTAVADGDVVTVHAPAATRTFFSASDASDRVLRWSAIVGRLAGLQTATSPSPA